MKDLIPRSSAHTAPELRLSWERRARALMTDVAVRAGTERDEDGVLLAVLRLICEATGWPLGHCYLARTPQLLSSTRLWHGAEDPRFAAFVAQTEATDFERGRGLPGRVLELGRPAWIEDVAYDSNFPRAASFLASGLGAAFGFPASAGAQVLAVLEFFADHPEPPDESLLDVLHAIGILTGQHLARCRAEAALARSEARFRAVTDAAKDAVIAADMWGNVSFWSPSATTLLGHDAASMVGQPLDRIIPHGLRQAHRVGLDRLRETGESRLIGRAVEVSALRADGVTVPVELTLGHQAEAGLVTAVIRDISERKAAEAKLLAHQDELRRQHVALQKSHAELIDAQRLMERIFTAYAEILPGTVLDGRYRLEEAIGAGGFGVVYRARQVSLDRPVAVKLFRPASGRVSAEQLRRFQREGPAMLRVRHVNAVSVLDAGVSSEGLPYLVMELLDGRTLAEALEHDGPLSPRRAAIVAAEVAEALSAVHAAGLVHRDIKPENVFLHREGGAIVTRILDFGIARTLDDEPDSERLTHTGRSVGTPAWIAPERLGGEAGDERADVWCTAALLYRCVSGRPPFSRVTHWTAMAALDRVSPLAALDAGIPAALDGLVRAGLAFAPDERPSAADLAAALRELAPSLPDHPVAPTGAPPSPASTTDLTG